MILEKVNGSLLESKTIVKVKIIEMKRRKKKSPEVKLACAMSFRLFFVLLFFICAYFLIL